MLCSVCNLKEATIHIEQEGLGTAAKSMHLCRRCAEKNSLDPDAFEGYALAEFLLKCSDLMARQGEDRHPQRHCSHCGLSAAEFSETGRLGCPRCYDVFEERLDALLTQIHRGSDHRGKTKTPDRQIEDAQEAAALQDLHAELAAAIAAENYERAAQLRDAIRSLQLEPTLES